MLSYCTAFFSMPIPIPRKEQNLFTLWCHCSIDRITPAGFSGLICVNYHVCNHRKSDYFLKQVESSFCCLEWKYSSLGWDSRETDQPGSVER